MTHYSNFTAGRPIFDPRSEATTDVRSARQRSCRSILEIDEIKTVPYVPLSHPFIERLIGTIHREYLDHVPFWNARDLERKLSCFQDYYNRERPHQGVGGAIPEPELDNVARNIASLDNYRWKSCCRGLYQLPAAA
jgi:transposase InsO family protein